MSVEELFRDAKSRRNGLSLRQHADRQGERFDRFLLIVALAYLLLVGLGLQAKLDFDPSAWCTNRACAGVQRVHHRPGDAGSRQLPT